MLSPFTFARRQGLYRGVFGGSRGWLVIGATVWAGRLLRRTLGRNEEVVAVEVLQPGQAIRLEAIPVLTRRERKAQHRASTARRRAAQRTT
jgi:hypothetical protein